MILGAPRYTLTAAELEGVIRAQNEPASDYARLLFFGFGWCFDLGGGETHVPAWKLPLAGEVPAR